MAEEEMQIVRLRDDFYRDSFSTVIFLICSIITASILLIMLMAYIYLNKPVPVTFSVHNEWRVQPDVALDRPFLSGADMLQWVADAFPRAFVYDFVHYNDQLKAASQFFTENGWKAFLNQLNNFANLNTIRSNKLFVNGSPDAAPFLLNENILGGRYSWWVQLPININYAGLRPLPTKTVTFHILVVRVPTVNNLMGVGIENVIIAPPTTGP